MASDNSVLNVDDTRYNPEPVLIQAFIAKSSVKALNKSVLRWLARLD